METLFFDVAFAPIQATKSRRLSGMSEPPELWVLVDNTNTGILYSNGAEWTPTTNVVDAFEQTATSTTVSGATLSYHFNGMSNR